MEVSKDNRVDLTAKLNLQENHKGKSLFSSKKNRLIISAISLVVLIGIGSYFLISNISQNKRSQPSERGWGQRPGGAENFGPSQPPKRTRWSGSIPNPPKDKITFYKGFWAGNLFYPDENTGLKLDPEQYKSWGINIVNIAPGFEINSKGEVRYPPDFPTNEDIDARMGELATKLYQANIRLTMTLLVHYKEDFSQAEKGEKWAGEPVSLPKEIVEKPGYLDNFNKVVEDMAKIAQKYHIEMFAPMGEPENLFGVKAASVWNQEILPKIRKSYQGKIFYKGDLHKGEGDNLNFKGYDVLGIMPHPAPPPTDLEELRKIIDFNMDKGLAWSKRDGVPQVVVAEHGFKEGNEMWPAEDIGIVLEEGNKKLNGVYLSYPMPAVLKTANGEQIVKEMQKWFLK